MSRSSDNRKFVLPYGKHCIDQDDIAAVNKVLQSELLTTGPMVEKFEKAVARFSQTRNGAAVSSGTAALHAAVNAIGLRQGDEVIVPAMTFAATANAVVYCGGIPVFADVEPDTLLIDPGDVEEKITDNTKAVIAMDYAGQMCDYDALQQLASDKEIYLISDACHSLGGAYKGSVSGSCADMSVFSFHPVKNITTGEGGMVVSDDENLIREIKKFRNHGIDTDFRQREEKGSWHYEMKTLGYNYRMTDIQAALGISQLNKLPEWIEKRTSIANSYDRFFSKIGNIRPLKAKDHVNHAYHLYVVRVGSDRHPADREKVFKHMRRAGLKVNVHYIPVYYHPFYKKHFKTAKGLCPAAEEAYDRILTIPLFPAMGQKDIDIVCRTLEEAVRV